MTAAPIVRRRPVARADQIVVEQLGDEVLVYDLVTDRAHALGAKAARVWNACDGERDVDALSAHLAMDAASVEHALDELRDCHLLDGEVPPVNGGMTRRDLAFRTAKAGVAASAVPMIISIAAPTPAAAASRPTAAQCMLYTDEDCVNCALICGCCCCGQAGGGDTGASCKLCYTSSGCSTFSIPGRGTLDCSVGEKDHPNCKAAGTSYVCKNGQTVTLNSNTRCCTYAGSPATTTTT